MATGYLNVLQFLLSIFQVLPQKEAKGTTKPSDKSTWLHDSMTCLCVLKTHFTNYFEASYCEDQERLGQPSSPLERVRLNRDI